MCSAAVFSGMLYLLFVFSICKRKTSPCGLAGWVAIYIEGRRKKQSAWCTLSVMQNFMRG